MLKSIVSFALGVALTLYATSYVNTLMTEYNNYNSIEKGFTKIWCESDAFDKTVQDRIDCYIVANF